MSEKGKQREPLGREGLLWSDVYEHLALAGQTRPLAISSQNAVVFAPSVHRASRDASGSPTPKVSLLCYPIDNAAVPGNSSSHKTFALPLPSFPLPHLPATFVSFSPASDHFLAFFPLAPSPSGAASCSTWSWTQPASGEGGTLALWALNGTKGRAPADWKLQESWACPQGEEVVDVTWLGAPRLWRAASGVEDSAEGKSSQPTFARRARCGPPLLPSQHPTFVALSAAHAVTLYHPPTAPGPALTMAAGSQQVILRTTRCTVDGPGSATWGLMSESEVGEEARRRRRRVRRARFHTRENDDSIYLAMHSTVLPPPPPAASSGSAADTRNGSIVQPGGATGTAEILAGLGIDVDLPNLTGVTPLPDATATDETHAIAAGDLPLAQESEEELPSGDETFIEVVEITADFLVGEHTTLSSHPYPLIPLASSPEISASAILSHLAFSEVVPSDPAGAAGSRALGLVAVMADLPPSALDGQPSRPASELHQWRIDKAPSELSRAFAELEAASVPMLETATGLGNETALFCQARLLPSSVLTALEPIQGSESSVLVMEIQNGDWPAGCAGSFKVIDLATLQDASAPESAPLKVDPRLGHQVPTYFAATPNASFVARLSDRSSSVNFHLHPAFAGASDAENNAELNQRLGQALALALHRGSDVQDLVRVLPLRRALLVGGGTKRKRSDDVAAVEAVLRECWAALDPGLPAQPSPIGRSRWMLLFVLLQHALYRSIGSDRQHVADEILTLARHNSAFERCCSRPRTGRQPAYQLDAAFRLIRETELAQGTIERLILASVVESSWDSWVAKDARPLPTDFVVWQPTTRALLCSLTAHLASFAAFFAASRAPLALPPGVVGGPGASEAVGEMARAMLADLRARSALGDQAKLAEALDQLEGVLAKDAPLDLANASLLQLAIPPDDAAVDGGSAATLSRALTSLPAEAFDQAVLFRQMA